MEVLLTIGLVVLGGVALRLARKSAGESNPWRIAAEASGLTDLQKSGSGLEGRSGMLRVRLEPYRRNQNENGTRIVVAGLLLSPQDASLRRETLGTALRKRLGEREIELGDEAFDSEFYLQGQPPLVRAILDADTRRRVRRLLLADGDVAMSGNSLRVEIPDSVFRGGSSLFARYLRSALDVAQRLVRPEDIPERLAANARLDPEARVRLANLLTLLREYPGLPVTGEALRAACTDESEEIQIQAAIALGGEGRGVLLDVASREWADDSYVARAVVALGENLPRERASTILNHALRTRRVETARACLRFLGYHHGDAEAVETLAKVMVVEKGVLAAEAACALGLTTGTAAESPLVEALESDIDSLRVAAATALGHVGTVEAVVSLKQAEARYPDDKALRRATRHAIAEIQSRLTGASPGQLSLAEAQAGHVSLADGEPGRVSLAEGEGGRLSLAKEDGRGF